MAILFQKIKLNDIYQSGKEYKYVRPCKCSQCGSTRIWGHGYVERYFDGYDSCLYLKRWICLDCGCVISIRPMNYFSRHHCSIRKIKTCIQYRLKKGIWIRGPDLSRQKQGHWLRALKKNAIFFLGCSNDLTKIFQQLLLLGHCPIIRSA